MAKSVAGQTFVTDSGVRFRVVEDEFFPAGEHDKANGRYLDSLKPGLLVSAWYRAPTPLVTTRDGVCKLKVVEVEKERLTGATLISQRLGVPHTRVPVTLLRA